MFKDDLKIENEDIEKDMDERIDEMMLKGLDDSTIINELSGGWSTATNNYEDEDREYEKRADEIG